MAKRKCRICGEWIEDKSDSVPYKKGYCHTKCFNVAMKVVTVEKNKEVAAKAKTPKPQKELKDGLSEEEFNQKKQLCDYLRGLTGKDLPVKTYKLIEDYQKKYKMTFSKIEEDLRYFYGVKENKVEGDAIGIVPYIHTEAQEYYESLRDTYASNENIENVQDMFSNKKIEVKIDLSVEKPQIDLSQLGG